MASTKLKLRPDYKRRTGDIAVYIQVCIDSKVKLYSTGQKVNPELWDQKNQRVKKTNGTNEHVKINLLLEKKHQEIKDIIFSKTVNNESLSFEKISAELEPKTTNSKYFDLWFKRFTEFKKTEFKYSTIKSYGVLRNQILEFKNNKDFVLDDIDFSFYESFRSWLILKKGHTNSTVNKRLKILKTFLNYCSNYDIYDSRKLTKFKMLEEKPATKIALNEKELKLLWNHDFEDNKRLDRVRDLFVFACVTGLRESDIQNLTKSNIVNNEIYLNVIKTSTEIRIPLNDYSSAILKKYNFKLPKISQQRLNSYLKEVGMKVGINDPQKLVKFQGGKRFESTVPRYELLKSHVGRRTFITLSIMKGIPIPVIQSMTGHRDLASFQKYIQIGSESKIEAMKNWSI
ncbi:MAG: site-specific integrase [Cytophagales bacterium]|nr:site-specific integrase [Cytophagales bacterium]